MNKTTFMIGIFCAFMLGASFGLSLGTMVNQYGVLLSLAVHLACLLSYGGVVGTVYLVWTLARRGYWK